MDPAAFAVVAIVSTVRVVLALVTNLPTTIVVTASMVRAMAVNALIIASTIFAVFLQAGSILAEVSVVAMVVRATFRIRRGRANSRATFVDALRAFPTGIIIPARLASTV